MFAYICLKASLGTEIVLETCWLFQFARFLVRDAYIRCLCLHECRCGNNSVAIDLRYSHTHSETMVKLGEIAESFRIDIIFGIHKRKIGKNGEIFRFSAFLTRF